jgi:DNA-binding NtrC family response regulator
MVSQTILIIDDDVAVRTSLELTMKQSGFHGISASSPEEALTALKTQPIELIIMDMNFSVDTSGEEGLKLLKDIKRDSANIPVILITAWASIQLAVEGMKSGAADFISKPWNNDHLLQSVKTALTISNSRKTIDEVKPERKKLDGQYNLKNLVGEDPEFLSVLDTIGKISSTDASVLIIGESGTGKELVAEAIHNNSHRKNQAFVKVNLGGIASTLFESEMFGHKKGAFTDAKHDRMGRFEMAHKGSIFLDEIGDLSLNDQVKLLRVLQDRKFEVLGSSETRSVDVRVISATNRDLAELVTAGDFREDLYYRINLITVKIPALRERPDDIPLLVDHFLSNLKTTYKRSELRITRGALEWLKDLPWPGNIRELKNLIERSVLVTNKDILDIDDFTEHYHIHRKKPVEKNLPPVGSATLDDMEISLIKQALKFHDNNISKAAKSLGLSRSALYRRMEKYGLDK